MMHTIRCHMRRFLVCAGAIAILWPATGHAQSIAVRTNHFVVDSGDGRGPQPKFLLLISYFDALRAGDLEGDLEYIRNTLRFDGIRIFPNWQDFPTSGQCPAPIASTLFDSSGNVRGDTSPPSGQLQRLIDVIVAAGQRGLMVDVTFTRDTVPNLSVDNYIRAVTRMATLLRPFRNVLFDLQNERDLSGRPQQFLSLADTRRLRDAIVANPDPAQGDANRVLVASGGGLATDAISFTQQAGLHAIAYHDPRVATWFSDTAAVVQSLTPGNMPVYLQEPQSWDGGLTFCGVHDSTRGDRDPQHFRTAVRNAKLAGGAAWTFHTRQGFALSTTSLRARIQADPVERALLEGNPATGTISLAAEADATSWPIGVTLTVDLSGHGTGTVTASGGGLTCTGSGVSCSGPFPFNSTVTFTATPAAGMVFLGWGGACSQTGPCTILTTANQLITATFVPAPQIAPSFYHLDAVGSVRAVTNQSGGTVRTHDYFAFGDGPVEATTPDRLRYAGKERDPESGLDYFGGRYYASRTGRFTTIDPETDAEAALVDPQRWNRYTYALNTPLKFNDPDGRNPLLIMGGVGSVVFGGWKVYMNVREGRPWHENVGVEAAKGLIVGATLGLAAPAIAGTTAAEVGVLSSAGASISGPLGTIARNELDRMMNAGRDTVLVITKLTQSPAANRGLSASAGDAAQALAAASRTTGSLYMARIPQQVINMLQRAGLVEVRQAIMNGVHGVEYRFRPEAMNYLWRFFEEMSQ